MVYPLGKFIIFSCWLAMNARFFVIVCFLVFASHKSSLAGLHLWKTWMARKKAGDLEVHGLGVLEGHEKDRGRRGRPRSLLTLRYVNLPIDALRQGAQPGDR
jgi:hypothetical protein